MQMHDEIAPIVLSIDFYCVNVQQYVTDSKYSCLTAVFTNLVIEPLKMVLFVFYDKSSPASLFDCIQEKYQFKLIQLKTTSRT